MRKILLALSVLVVLTIAVSTATAQNSITFGSTNSNTLTFTGAASSGWTLTFAGNDLTGTATGAGGWSSISGTYSINDAGLTITGTSTGPGTWNIAQTGTNPITGNSSMAFSIGTLLTGDLQLINLGQLGKTGVTNYDFVADMTVTGGSLDSLVGGVGANMKVQITLDLDSATSLAALGVNGTEGAKVSSGEIDQTPEPGSMALVGSGMLLLGGLVRRRWWKT